MERAKIKPVDVRAVLAKTPTRDSLKNWELSKCYAEFWLQPQVHINGLWQGGESIQVKRVSENEFKVGCLEMKTLEQAAKYIEELLDRYHVPYFGTEPWEHPFDYNI